MTGPDDADATRIVTHPAAAGAAAGASNVLPAGWRLHEFEIESKVAEGGFGIVYLARDLHLKRQVAIKEFMPSALASRHAGMSVVVKSDRYRDTFEAGLRSFINEARLLAQFDHPALVKVYQFWEENGTAYMVMPYCKGVTLKDWLREQSAPPSEDALLRLVAPLLEPLEQLHAHNVFHRDIAPDNILVLESGQPLLLDFGAARQIIGDMTQALTVILKPGYAPIEQYAEVPSMRQGPWTDIYALAALLYFAVTRRAPPPAVGRMMKDDLVPAATAAAGRYSARLLEAIDRGLKLRPEDRPASIGEFRELLGVGELTGTIAPGTDDATVIRPRPRPPGTRPPGTKPPAAARARAGAIARPEATPVRRSPVAAIAAGVAALLVVGVAIAWWLARPAAAPAAEKTLAPAAVAPKDLPAAPQPQQAAPDVPAPSAAEAAPASPPAPGELLREAYERRTPSIDVRARAAKSRLVIGRDKMKLSVTSLRGGYLYVLMAGTEGELTLQVPGPGRRAEPINPGEEFPLGGDVGGPAGVDRLLFIVSARPLALDATLAPGESFAKFDLQKIAAARTSAGASGCAGVITPCDAIYGAALLDVSEVER